jgi:hypothetical protein
MKDSGLSVDLWWTPTPISKYSEVYPAPRILYISIYISLYIYIYIILLNAFLAFNGRLLAE